jgi:predicted O-linked N-acetylglucosamine transferase (SPINDLY family)
MAAAAPATVEALVGRARRALAEGRLPDAQDAFLAALEREPRGFAALAGMTELAERAGDAEAARHYGERLVAAHPDDARAHFALGNFFARQYDFPRARACYREAVARDPAAAGVWNNLGNVEKYLGDLPESIACYDRAIACDPGNAALASSALISLYYDTSTSHADLYARHAAWAARHAARFYPQAPSWPNERDPERPLRVGYASGSFDGRVLGHFLRGVLPHHNSSRVTTFGYSSGWHADAVTDELRAALGHWRDIRSLDDDAAAAAIASDAIDILVDLDGHTPDARLAVFARKAAPVQITWLGYWNTTGLATMDWIITDPRTTPDGSPQRFSERLLHLPETRLCYAPAPYAPAVAPLPCRGRGVLTFGSFNRYDKLAPAVIDAWAEILRDAPAARLVIKNSAIGIAHARETLAGRFAERGIDTARIELRARSPHAAMLAEYGDIDLALDTFPYNGGLTTCEALWMGVPMVAIEEERMISRQTATMLRVLGLEGFVAATAEQYVELALQWSRRPEELAAVRMALRERMRASALCDGARFARDLEDALRRAWRGYCAGVDPV